MGAPIGEGIEACDVQSAEILDADHQRAALAVLDEDGAHAAEFRDGALDRDQVELGGKAQIKTPL